MHCVWKRLLMLGAVVISGTTAHTWIDCIDTDRSIVYDKARNYLYGGDRANGMCVGYIKNYPGCADSDVNKKSTFKILKEHVPKGVPVYSIEAAAYSGWCHSIQVKPGKRFFFGYMENVHVAKDKAGRNTHYGVYWTGKPDSQIEKTTDLTEDKSSDGKLHKYDDGNCGESTWSDGSPSGRAGNDYPCVGELPVPARTKAGIYHLVWVWRFYNEQDNSNISVDYKSYG